MFKMSVGWEKLENVEEQPSVYVLACIGSAYVRRHVLACIACIHVYIGLFLYVCVWSLVHAWAGSDLRIPAYACRMPAHIASSYARMPAGRNPSLGIWTSFSSVLCLFAILTSFLTIFCIQLYVSCYISSCCESNITFPLFFSPNHDFEVL